jgi:uncharacterized protein (DUF2147 family)
MMRRRILGPLSALFFLLTASLPALAETAEPVGVWQLQGASARVRIESCAAAADLICGYVVWLDPQTDSAGRPLRDVNNPDPARRRRLLLGHQILLGLVREPDGRFDGSLYNAADGMAYDVSLHVLSDDQLEVEGCFLMMFCSTQVWVRSDVPLPGELTAPTGAPGGPRTDHAEMP